MYKNITPDYYGYRDEDDGVLATREAVREVIVTYNIHFISSTALSHVCCIILFHLAFWKHCLAGYLVDSLLSRCLSVCYQTVFSSLCVHSVLCFNVYVHCNSTSYTHRGQSRFPNFDCSFLPLKQWNLDPGFWNLNLQQVLIARVVDEYKDKIKKLREDVERTGGVFGGAELALLEGNGTNRTDPGPCCSSDSCVFAALSVVYCYACLQRSHSYSLICFQYDYCCPRRRRGGPRCLRDSKQIRPDCTLCCHGRVSEGARVRTYPGRYRSNSSGWEEETIAREIQHDVACSEHIPLPSTVNT